MRNLYATWIESWERSLTLQDRNRRIFPFSWGTRWVCRNGTSVEDPLAFLKSRSQQALEESDRYFAAPPVKTVDRSGNVIRIPTPTPTPVENNNWVSARIFPGPDKRRAVVVIPQWNADQKSHVVLCRALRRLGLTAVRITLPYHEERRPEGMERADYMVSPNVGRTLHAIRQAVLEVRQIVGWLKDEGYEQVAVVGTSVGSCVGYLAFVHDPRLEIGVFNHVSAFFADVVWSGLSTRYVRWGLEGFIELGDLRECWAPVSPYYHVEKLVANPRKHLMITALHDLTFLPRLNRKVFERYREVGVNCDHVELPCGHYTVGRFPFKYLAGWHICRYLSAVRNAI